jgi:hypothetical protein
MYHFVARLCCARDAAVSGAEINSPGCRFHRNLIKRGYWEVGRRCCGGNYDGRSQERSVGPPIALLENPVNPHVGMTVAGGFADGFGNANADALRLRACNRSRLPSGPGEKDAFRAF